MRTLRTLAIFVVMVLPPVFMSGSVAANDAPVISGTEQIHLLVGRSMVLRTDRSIMRVSLSTPDIADAMVTSPRELLVLARRQARSRCLSGATRPHHQYEVVSPRLTRSKGRSKSVSGGANRGRSTAKTSSCRCRLGQVRD